jgi:hypothetical protein
LKEPDEISEVLRERRPGKSGKGTVIPSKIWDGGGGRNRAFEMIIIGRPATLRLLYFRALKAICRRLFLWQCQQCDGSLRRPDAAGFRLSA